MNFIGEVKEISLEMKQGVMPAHIKAAMNSTAGEGNVVLIHGYCAGSNPWSANPSVSLVYMLEHKGILTCSL
jgi:hypothetical protein